MLNKEYKELSKKLHYGLDLAEFRMLERYAKLDVKLSQATPNGEIEYVSAKELLKRWKKLKPDFLQRQKQYNEK